MLTCIIFLLNSADLDNTLYSVDFQIKSFIYIREHIPKYVKIAGFCHNYYQFIILAI